MLVLYSLLVIVPWILTLILAQRPIGAESYIYQKGFSESNIRIIRNWKVAVDVLNSIAGLITIPFLSALLAQAAVVFCQRGQAEEFLRLPDLFVLSDRGWTHPHAVWASIWSRKKQTVTGTKWTGSFLIPAAWLLIIGALQQPLYQILVPTSSIAVATCDDTLYQYSSKNATHCKGHDSWHSASIPIGQDVEPAQMALIYHNKFIPRLKSDFVSISLDEEQPTLWSDETTEKEWAGSRYFNDPRLGREYRSLRRWLPGYASQDKVLPRFFVAGLEANSTTGVLRQHLMRFNSSVRCSEIDRTSFPTTCPGEGPFSVSLKRANDTTLRVCVPGKIGIFPWTLSRNRQTITEELFLDMWDGDASGTLSSNNDRNISGTVRCETNTTRGYFELGSRRKSTYGPLLDRWPGREEMQHDFNDWVDAYSSSDDFIPSEEDTYAGKYLPDSTSTGVPSAAWRVSGPLTVSAIALFGNSSWVHNAISYAANMTFHDASRRLDRLPWQRICEGMPFTATYDREVGTFPNPAKQCRWAEESISAGFTPTPRDLLDVIHEWIGGFAPSGTKREMTNIEDLLHISLFAANRALLTFYSPNVDGTSGLSSSWRGRTIRSSPGHEVQKPVVSKTALIVLSILIAMQLLGLAYLAYYIYHVPTWTAALDAKAMARIGASLGRQDLLSPVGSVTQNNTDALMHVNGLIGVVERRDVPEESQDWRVSHDASDMEASDLEMRHVSDKGHYVDVKEQSHAVQLGLGAPGVIRSSTKSRGARQRKDKRHGKA
ncbi:hypothetical protein CC86DRAFT_293228 [Ophiobolus disseminans]|uniref:Ig-like domain-containing protein n=1 Tax=Ophiobolus disseminans TaxID=1469910 RepID=A0A6A6ZYW7_9PLEO|nr:hypothetical protein CC86DRAFT_293228 [Ophiobolus disseminans]